MALKLTKNSKIIFAVSIVVLSAALGFLIWRVNQEDNLDPDDSDAGGSYNGTCWYCCGYPAPTCTCSNCALSDGWRCDSSGKLFCDKGSSQYCSSSTNSVTCGDGASIPVPTGGPNASQPASWLCPNCNHAAPGDDEPVGDVECNIGSQCTADEAKCYWPEVAYCNGDGTCSCKGGDSNGCTDDSPKCTPSCPSGYSPCSGSDCSSDTKTAECSATCDGCNNLYFVKITCDKEEVVVNSCDSGTWVTKPSGNIDFDADIAFSARGTDSDGIKNTSITAKLCTGIVSSCTTGDAVTYVISSTNATATTFGGTLSSSTDRLEPGTYTLSLAWEDTLGNSSANCALTTTFTVLAEETNPDWDITKGVVELCIDENTENPKSELTYTITVRNTGTAAGTISLIEDVLDSKILSGGLIPTNITSPGAYANGKITWSYASPYESIAAGASKVYTYKIVVDKENFGTYANTVTLTPVGSSSIQASANITADCVYQEVPETGIFDSTLGRIVVGFILVLFGGVVYNLPNGIFVSNKKDTALKYRTKFENKISNK